MDYTSAVLIKSCQSENVTVVKALLERGACVNYTDHNGVTPLQVTSAHGRDDVTSLLLTRGADINKSNNMGWTPVMHAARNGHLKVFKTLIESGADINIKNRLGSDLLSLAAASGNHLLVEMLLKALTNEAILSILKQNIVSPIILATLFGHSFIVKSLIDNGCDFNGPLKYSGVTALMVAAAGGHTLVASLLLEHGANPDLKNALQQTALDIATVKGYTNLSVVLKSKTKTNIRKTDSFESFNIDTYISGQYGWSLTNYHPNCNNSNRDFLSPQATIQRLTPSRSYFPHSSAMTSPIPYSHCPSVLFFSPNSSTSSDSYFTPNSSPDRNDNSAKEQILCNTVHKSNLQSQNMYYYSPFSLYQINESPMNKCIPSCQSCPIPVPPISPYKDIPFSYNLTPQSCKSFNTSLSYNSNLNDHQVSQEICSSPLHNITSLTTNKKCLNYKYSSSINKQCLCSDSTIVDINKINNNIKQEFCLKCWWDKQVIRRFHKLLHGKRKYCAYPVAGATCLSEEMRQDLVESGEKKTMTVGTQVQVKNEDFQSEQLLELKPDHQDSNDSERFYKLLLDAANHGERSLTPDSNAKHYTGWESYVPVLLKHEIDIETFLTISKSDLEEMNIQNPEVQNEFLQLIRILKQDIEVK